MTNPEQSLEGLEPFQNPGFLYPLLKRANDAAAVLSQHRYTGAYEWVAEAAITIVHGDNEREMRHPRPLLYPRYKLTIRVSPSLSVRWLTLEEAEMIAARLQQEQQS